MKKKTWRLIIAAIVAYVLVCTALQMMGLWHMNKQNSTAAQREYGTDRLQKLNDSGVQTEHKIYTEEETEEDKTKEAVSLFYFPAQEQKSDKYVLICPGGAYANVEMSAEGYPIAAKFNDYGYTAFILQYRVGDDGGNYHAIDDLARALSYIKENSESFDVNPDNYVLAGFSAGGNLIGLFGTEERGYANYEGIAKPTALLMGYPWCNLNTHTPNAAKFIMYTVLNNMGYNGLLGEDATKEQQKTMLVPRYVTPNYPPTYIVHGDKDVMVPAATHSDVLVKALEKNGVTYVYEKAAGANHGFGIGEGTSAEGWMERAIAFFENLS